MKKRGIEFSVGLFVVTGILVLSFIVFSIGGFRIQKGGYPLKVLFGFTSGVDEGAPVRVGGITVGEVKDVNIVPSQEENRNLVELTLWLDDGIKVEIDAIIAINTLGLFGEKYVEITPGHLSSEIVTSGSIVRGQDSFLLEDIKDQIRTMSTQFANIASKINEIFGDDELMLNLKAALNDSKHLVTDMRSMAQEGSKMFANLNQKVDNVFGDEEALTNLKEAFKNSKYVIEDFRSVAKNVNTIADNTNDVIKKIKSGQGTIGKLVYEDEVYENIKVFSRTLRYQPWRLLQKPKEEGSSQGTNFGPANDRM